MEPSCSRQSSESIKQQETKQTKKNLVTMKDMEQRAETKQGAVRVNPAAALTQSLMLDEACVGQMCKQACC